MIIHFSILVVILLVSLIYERKRTAFTIMCVEEGSLFETKRLPWILILGYIAFLAAMRSNTNDTVAYIDSFQHLEASWKSFINQVLTATEGKDWAFNACGTLFKMLISNDYHMWFALFAIVETLALIYILRRNAVSLWDCCFFLFCSTIYYNYFSMMRQWFAVTLLFFASKYLEEEKCWKYILMCLVVAQFHNSAYLMIIVCFLVQGKAWSKKQLFLIVTFCSGLVFLNPILNSMENGLTGTTYDYAILAMNSGTGSSGIRILIAMVPVVWAFYCRKQIHGKMINICVNMSVINLMLNILAMFTSGLYIIRFALYMNVYNMILYPYLLNCTLKGKNRILIKLCFYAMYLAFYVYQMKYQGAFSYGSDILGNFY